MVRKLTTLKSYSIGDRATCRWDKAGKTWFSGTILKFKNCKNKPEAWLKFDDGDEKWFHIRRGWMKCINKADSEAEESDDGAAGDLEEDAPDKATAAASKKKTAKKGVSHFVNVCEKVLVLFMCRVYMQEPNQWRNPGPKRHPQREGKQRKLLPSQHQKLSRGKRRT